MTIDDAMRCLQRVVWKFSRKQYLEVWEILAGVEAEGRRQGREEAKERVGERPRPVGV